MIGCPVPESIPWAGYRSPVSLRPEPDVDCVRAETHMRIEKILLVDGIHQINHHFLHDLILKAGNRDWPLFPVLLGGIDSAQRLYLILACHEPPMQLADVLLGVDLVLCVRDPVDPGAGILSQTSECLIQLLHCHQVSDGVELSLRIFLGEFSYSVDVCAHNHSSSESRLCLLSTDSYACFPLPSSGSRGRSLRKPCGSPPSPVLWGCKTAQPSFRASF